MLKRKRLFPGGDLPNFFPDFLVGAVLQNWLKTGL